MTKVEKLFFELVKIDSPSGSEREISMYLSDWLESVGFKFRVDKTGNIYAFTDDKPKFFMCAHMDTVEPGRNIKPQIVDGKICSDGSTILGADNKASVCAIVVAVNEYKEKFGKLPEIEIVFSVKEETGGGVEFFDFKWLKSKRGLIFDLARPLGQITTAAPYIYNFYAKFIGKPSHSSRPSEGINSLVPAIKFASRVKVGKFDNGETTINIGKFASGSGINTIPEETLVEGEVRSTNHKKFLLRLKKIEKIAKGVVKGSPVKLEYEVGGYCPGYKWSEESSLIQSIVKVLGEEVDKVKYSQSTGVSDANSFNGEGLQVVTLSDGVCDPHTKKESIKQEDLAKLSKIISRFLESW